MYIIEINNDGVEDRDVSYKVAKVKKLIHDGSLVNHCSEMAVSS